MAAANLSFLLLLTLTLTLSLSSSLLHIDARNVAMGFNKIPSKTNQVFVQETQEPFNTKEQQQEQEPNFIPENENSYALYGHESGQHPTSTSTTTTTNNNNNGETEDLLPKKYLPKNYNPVAYVTQPEDFSTDSTRSFVDKTTYYNGGNNYYNNGHGHGVKDSKFLDREYTTSSNENNYYNNNGVNNYNNVRQQEQKGMSKARFVERTNNDPTTPITPAATTNNNNYYVNNVQPQGMRDSRILANGKYFYNVNRGKHRHDP